MLSMTWDQEGREPGSVEIKTTQMRMSKDYVVRACYRKGNRLPLLESWQRHKGRQRNGKVL